MSAIMRHNPNELFCAMRERDLSVSQIHALFALVEDDGLAVHTLGEALGLSLGAAGRAVEALVQDGLVERREDAHDRRVKRVYLSAQGRAFTEELFASRAERLASIASRLDGPERAALAAALTPVLATLGEPS